jgi:predicted RNase H-like HicB family nuclease
MEHRFVYEAVIEPGEKNGYFIWFPDLPDAFTQASDMRTAALNAAEVLELVLADYIADGAEPPTPTFGYGCDDGATRALVSVRVTVDDVLRMGTVSSTEAAHILKVSKGRIAQMVASGQLDSFGEGTARLISLRSVNARATSAPKAGRPRKTLTNA